MALITLALLKAGLTADSLGQHAGGYSTTGAAFSDAMLTDLIAEVQGNFTAVFGWRVEATHAIEMQRGTGTNVLYTWHRPICYTNHINLIGPGTPQQVFTDVYSTGATVTYPELGRYQNYNPIFFQQAGLLTIFPAGVPIQIDYIYGYPMGALLSSVSAGATSIPLLSGFGFAPNTDYTIYDHTNGTEQITTASTYSNGTNTLTLSSPLQYAHTTGTCLAITNLPFGVVRAVRRIVERRVLGRNSPALTGLKSRGTGESQKLTEAYAEVPELSPAELAALSRIIDHTRGIV